MGTDDNMYCNGTENDGNVRSACEVDEGTDRSDVESDTKSYK
jgi:hypothetical protein